ncbi:MAG: hypothetical protein ABSA43_02290 [Candidatus Microgenomates bacterium]|jgi:hypothetical protein
MVKSGWLYSFGLGFWGANGHDGIWHVAVAQALSRGSFEMPVFAGSPIQNYHLGFGILLAVLHKLTTLPLVNLYFQVIPPILALLIGILTYYLVILWKNSKSQAFWAVFFVYFGGSWGWLIGKGESAFWSQQAISTLINPPFALSLVFILLGLIFLLKYFRTHNSCPSGRRALFIILTLLYFGLLIQIKAYAGILVLGGLFVSGAVQFIKEKKLTLIYLFGLDLIISLAIFLPFNKNAGSLIVYQPFWFLETMMGIPDRLGWQRFYSAMLNYKSGGVWFKGILAYLTAFVIFVAGNFGTRVVGLFYYLKKKFDWLDLMLVAILGAGIVIPILFIQQGTPWNTIQFLYYSLFAGAILSGVVLGRIIHKPLLIILVVLLTVPTTVITLVNDYLPARPPAKLSTEELNALQFLSKQPQGVVLTYPYDSAKASAAEANPPRPLYLYVSSAYVAAFSGQPVYLEDEVNLDITGYAWQERRQNVLDFYASQNQQFVRNFLKENSISYIYWVKPQRATLGEGQLGLMRVFENKEVDIYKVE